MAGNTRPGAGNHSHSARFIRSEAVRDYEARRPNKLQLERLAQQTGVPADELADKSIAALKEEFLPYPGLFDWELVCGQVVKVDPVTGLKYPVAGATVNVYDTVCDWLWFFPPYWPWSWGFRFPFCVRELIATVTTNVCGDFCVLVPRWDIEWIREWILERWCFPEILQRPSVGDVLQPYVAGGKITPPQPPDPASLLRLLDARQDLADAVGPAAVAAIRAAGTSRTVGSPATGLSDVLASNAFVRPVPAPVPAELRAMQPAEAMTSFASRLGLRSAEGELDLSASYGPFLRCVDIEVPVWVPFFTVPDITFEVTQDIAGTTTVIYDGAFDVNWSGSEVNVELDASPAAIAGPFPGCQPEGIVCEDVPAILRFGYMDTDPAYIDPNTGFAVMMNKPDATPDTPSTAPVLASVPLFGCAPNLPYYRVMASYANSTGLTPTDENGSITPIPASDFGPATPLVSAPWQVAEFTGGSWHTASITPVDANGWYSTDYLSWEPESLLIPWEPADGVYQLTLQTGDGTPGSITPIASSETLRLVVDSSYPTASIVPTSWNYVGGPPNPIPPDEECILIQRNGQDIQVQLTYNVSANHLYSVNIAQDGCNTADVTGLGGAPVNGSYVYDGPLDNSLSGVATYQISADAPDGCYSWTIWAWSRAFSPNDGEGLVEVDGSAWNYVQTWRYSNPFCSIAIITNR